MGKFPGWGTKIPQADGKAGKGDIEEYTECDIIYFKNLYLYLYIFIHNLYKHLSINYCVCTDSGLLLEGYTR